MKSSKLFRMTPVRGVWSGRIPALQEPTAREEDASISRLQAYIGAEEGWAKPLSDPGGVS